MCVSFLSDVLHANYVNIFILQLCHQYMQMHNFATNAVFDRVCCFKLLIFLKCYLYFQFVYHI